MFKVDELKIRRKAWLQAANIPKNRRGWELFDCKDVDPANMKAVKSWVKLVEDKKIIRSDESKCGWGLLFSGSPGHGKTTLGLAILQGFIKDLPLEVFSVGENSTLIKPCYFTTFNDLLDLKGQTMENATEENTRLLDGILGNCENDAYNIRILLIDDVGNEHQTDSQWQKNMLHHVLRSRFNAGLPTIVTTNIPLENWYGRYGDATASFAKEAFAQLHIDSKKGDLRI
jgi:DNA replication protein DnaC